MGVLAFTRTLASRRRRKEQVTLEKMRKQNLLYSITNQIHNAQKAKTAAEQLFHSSLSTRSQAMQTMMNMELARKNYESYQEMSTANQTLNRGHHDMISVFDKLGNDKDKKISIDELKKLPSESLMLMGLQIEESNGTTTVKALQSDGTFAIIDNLNHQYLKVDNNNIVLKDTLKLGDFKTYVFNMFKGNEDVVKDKMLAANMEVQNVNNEIQKNINEANYYTNMFNTMNEFISSTELENLNMQETALKEDLDRLNTEDTMLASEIQALEKAQEEALKKDAPKYIA